MKERYKHTDAGQGQKESYVTKRLTYLTQQLKVKHKSDK